MRQSALAAAVWLLVAMGVLGGCPSGQGKGNRDDAAVVLAPAPSYRVAAAAYNERVAPLDRFRAQATVQFRYVDKDGKERIEQPEGTIQIVRPDKLALSLGKLGQVKFWLGSDQKRYWWLDMMDEPVAFIGGHDAFNDRAARRLGISLAPRSLIRVLCLTPMDTEGWGATQWSDDGERLGITTTIDGGGRQRVWVDPANYRPIKIELYDAAGKPIVIAHCEGDERVEVAAGSTRGGSPWIPKSVSIYAVGTDATIRVSLSSAKNDGVNDKAFEFEEIVGTYGVERVVDWEGGESGEQVANEQLAKGKRGRRRRPRVCQKRKLLT
jgi:hypothetical protein